MEPSSARLGTSLIITVLVGTEGLLQKISEMVNQAYVLDKALMGVKAPNKVKDHRVILYVNDILTSSFWKDKK